MPEKVTREEKIIELAIMKAREVQEELKAALRDGEDTSKPIIEKVKRPPKNGSSVTKYGGIKADPIHANAGPTKEGFTNVKKANMTDAEMQRKAEELRSFAMITDRKIRVMLAKGELNSEELKEINRLEGDIKEAEKWVTDFLKGRFGSSGSSKVKKENEAGYKGEPDDRDIARTYGDGKAIVDNLKESNKAMKELSSERLTTLLRDIGKLESDMRQLVDNLMQSKDTSNADKLR